MAPPSHAGSAMSPTVTEVTLPREVVNEYVNPFASHLGTTAFPAPTRVDPTVSDAANATVVETATAAAALHAIAFFALEYFRRRFGERSASCIGTLRSHSCWAYELMTTCSPTVSSADGAVESVTVWDVAALVGIAMLPVPI